MQCNPTTLRCTLTTARRTVHRSVVEDLTRPLGSVPPLALDYVGDPGRNKVCAEFGRSPRIRRPTRITPTVSPNIPELSDVSESTEVADLTEMLESADHALLTSIAQDIVSTREVVERVFAQTSWICQMLTAIQATLPPPMQQALQQAFIQMASDNNHGG